jgi:hypothetical protein
MANNNRSLILRYQSSFDIGDLNAGREDNGGREEGENGGILKDGWRVGFY